MPPGDEYKRHAAECLRAASEVNDPKQRAALLEMAQAWARLAEQAVKNNQTDIVYEAVPRRRAERPAEK
jgi:hypothetical protein